ncbi:CPBP family intramembrane glutamic endopeptidase [Lewinella sp. JB7]|uniref:CPBP family intramembrane glutamic endopeptidase n=1 Tax=Lewinella sp. JB7 TaxID=2962887 RepID=UPI0020CA0173|nr:CPBP family intramembrane glutamic endopeptidase [Lewinella sp. JB7]MCP9234383.1 CPBP family intramembrane metalloprotease [Lewinella sp. JB7]
MMSRLLWSCYVIVTVWISGVLSNTLPGDGPVLFVGIKALLFLPVCIYLYRSIRLPDGWKHGPWDRKLLLLFAGWFFLFVGLRFAVDNIEISFTLLAYAVVTTLVMVALEELIFRGITFSKGGGGASIRGKQYGSSLLFALLHAFNLLYTGNLGETVHQMVLAFGMGMFLSSVYLRYGRILYPIALHFMVNVVPEYKMLLHRPAIHWSSLSNYNYTLDERVLFSLVTCIVLTVVAHSVLPGKRLPQS